MISTAQQVVVRNADVKYILLTGGISMYLLISTLMIRVVIGLN